MCSIQIFRMRRCRLTMTVWLLLLCALLLVWCGGSSRPTESGGNTEEQTADWFTAPSCCSYCVLVGLVGGLASGLVSFIGGFIVWKCTKSNIVSLICSEKRKHLDEKRDRLQKQSIKIQEEVDTWEAVLSPLKEVKSGLGNQREEFRRQLEEIEKEREENKERVQSVEKEIAKSEKEKATDKTEGYLREKQNLLNAQWKLEKRQEELEKQQLNMEKLLQKTDAMMATMTDRKGRVETHVQLINMQVEETERQDDRAHLHRE